MIGERDAAHFDVIFRRNGDFGVRIDLVDARAKLGAALAEDGFVSCRGAATWADARRTRTLPLSEVAQINKSTPAIARGIFPPAGQRGVVPQAVAAARVGHHDVITAIGEQMDFRRGRVRIGEDTERRFRRVARLRACVRLRVHADRERDDSLGTRSCSSNSAALKNGLA